MPLLDRLSTPWQVLAKEIAAFGVVGVVNLFVDVGLFNLLHFRVGLGPTTSNAISTAVATTISYFANRHWSFSHRARPSRMASGPRHLRPPRPPGFCTGRNVPNVMREISVAANGLVSAEGPSA